MVFGIDSVLAFCGDLVRHDVFGSFSLGQPLFVGLALAGLVGGATHCAAMCTPILITIGADQATPSQSAALHLGRLASYSLLGALSAAGNRLLWSDAWFEIISLIFLLSAALMMVLAAAPPTRWMVAQAMMRLYRPAAPILYRTLFQLRVRQPLLRMALVGALLGLMPCVMIFAALIAVSATGDARQAAAGMAIFTTATIPSLWIATRVAHRFRPHRWFEPIALLASAGVMVAHIRILVS
jgi:uncharacterized protein